MPGFRIPGNQMLFNGRVTILQLPQAIFRSPRKYKNNAVHMQGAQRFVCYTAGSI